MPNWTGIERNSSECFTHVDTPDDLFSYLKTLKEGERPETVCAGDGFNLTFAVDGPGWGPEIDYRVGRFVYEMQRDAMSMYTDITGKRISFRNRHEDIEPVLVTVKVRKGSLELCVELARYFTEITRNMDTHTAWLVFGVSTLLCGGYVFKKYSDRKEKLGATQANTDLMRTALSAVENNTKALAGLISRTRDGDVIRVFSGGRSEEIPAEEVRENLPSGETDMLNPAVRSSQVWGYFELIKLDNVTFVFSLKSDGAPTIKAIPSFTNSAALNAFFNVYASFLSRMETPKMRLLLSVVTEDGVVVGARILKVLDGDPSDVETLKNFLQN